MFWNCLRIQLIRATLYNELDFFVCALAGDLTVFRRLENNNMNFK